MKIAAGYRASIYVLSDVRYHKSYRLETTTGRSRSEELSSREERELTIWSRSDIVDQALCSISNR